MPRERNFSLPFITQTMKKLFPMLIIALLSCTPGKKEWQAIEHDFLTMPLSVRPNPLWFWNDSRVEPDELVRQIAGCKEAGYGGLSILPFGKNFEPEYLTDAYFDVYRLCMEEAKKQGMTLWIYDEYGFPSGTAGDINGDGKGRFKQNYPEHTYKRLDKIEHSLRSDAVFETVLPPGQMMAAVAMDTLTFERIDLIGNISDGKLRWQTPGSVHWKLMLFVCVDAGLTMMDYMSPEAVECYISMTHDEYFKRFGEYFGATVAGTFFDEPTLYYAQGRAWTPEFNTKFEAKHGFSPALYYPALWYDIGPETAQARNYLFGFRTDLYAEGYPKLVSDWSIRHGIRATGHQDNEEVVNPVGTSGDLMKCFKYQDVPGIDKIGGNRPAEWFYKVVSSAAHNRDRSLVMSETYGAMGNIGWDEIFGIAMEQYAKGINILIPHAVWYNTEKVVFKPELSLRNPIYVDSLRHFTDYLSRLNTLMQNDARWVGDVAVLYPIHAMQSEHYMDGPLGYYRGGVEIEGMDYVEVGTTLFDSLGCDFMFLHPEVLDEQCHIEGNRLTLNNKIHYNDFTTLIVPACRTISLSNLEKIRDFAAAGGAVIFTSCLPAKATFTADDSKVAAIVKEMIDGKKAIFVKQPIPQQLKTALEQQAGKQSLRFTSATNLRNVHKQLHAKNLWFFANPEAIQKNVQVELDGAYNLEVWDPHTGKTGGKLSAKKRDGKTSIGFTVGACKSVFIIEK